ncbi:MAG: twin-arginine translocase TatA/TatE family subunit [Dehalococcoidia bacterium]|nr:twin-arginine translocase TatA/TatE family subunit [Dehalococcoidia bacterium]
MPFRIGPTELIIILVIVMIVFGVGRLPEIGGALGKSIRSFKRSVTGDDEKAETVQSSAEKTESKA